MKKVGEYDDSLLRDWSLSHSRKSILGIPRDPKKVVKDAEVYYGFLTRGTEVSSILSLTDKEVKK